jgi:hypothetical protein
MHLVHGPTEDILQHLTQSNQSTLPWIAMDYPFPENPSFARNPKMGFTL